jgi:hypothetical protein
VRFFTHSPFFEQPKSFAAPQSRAISKISTQFQIKSRIIAVLTLYFAGCKMRRAKSRSATAKAWLEEFCGASEAAISHRVIAGELHDAEPPQISAIIA